LFETYKVDNVLYFDIFTILLNQEDLVEDTIGGFNSMIQKQKDEEVNALVSTVLFDDKLETIHDRVNIQKVKALTEKEYYVRGCTAMLDAIGTTIEHISNIHKYIRKEDVPAYAALLRELKNEARQLGASELTKLAREQEKLGKEGNLSFLKDKFGLLSEEYQRVAQCYKTLFDNVKEEDC
jgi:hypothetical protein